AGVTSGKISAVSTIGCFLGTFLPVLILIPTIGTYRTFLTFSLVLMITCLIGLWKTAGRKAVLPFAWMPVVIIVLFILGVQGTDKASTGMIYEKESAYNYIQVLENAEFRTLRLNEGQGMHSVYHPTILNYHGPWEQVLAAPFFNRPNVDPLAIKSMAIVGLAAGTTARQAAIVYPGIQIDGFEIDPVIVDIGRKYFGMTDPNLNVIVQDGRWGLDHSPKQYQVISVDAYRPPYIPAHMVTQEFFQMVFDHLTNDGVMVINVGRAPEDRRMIDALYATIHTIFPSVYVMDLPDTFNTIIFATKTPTETQNLLQNYQQLLIRSDISPLLMETLKVTIVNLQPAPTGGIVFTDDQSPVEWITNSMILNFFITGQAEILQ
ncbi:MAG: fused MFS/spermidine synthase, partial [Anaerolineaceae bacterium]|nr:fused MFS/spermidine synthase [Anaerolineaceae bacterium]